MTLSKEDEGILHKYFTEISPRIMKGRGYIIERIAMLDMMLDEFLARYFCSESERYGQFKKFILEKEFFTMEQKIRLIKKLEIHKNSIFNGEYTELDKLLRELNEVRNCVAHQQDDPFEYGLKINWNGKEIITTLDDNFLNEYEGKVQQIFKAILNIMVVLKFPDYRKSGFIFK